MADLAQAIAAAMPVGEYPHLVEFTTGHVPRRGYDFGGHGEWSGRQHYGMMNAVRRVLFRVLRPLGDEGAYALSRA